MNRKGLGIGAALLAFTAVAGFAQQAQPDRIVVPLTDPAKPALIQVEFLMGSVKVTGYEGKEVIVEATVREKAVTGERRVRGQMIPVPPEPPEPPVEATPPPAREDRLARQIEREYAVVAGRHAGQEQEEEEEKARQQKAAGLKKVPLSSSGLTVEEENNRVSVQIEAFRRAYDLVIKVPAGSSVKVESAATGGIRVENIGGEVEVENMNGPIVLNNVSGTVLASTANGDIEAVLARVAPDKPMSFATFNGDIDLTLPPDAKVTLGLKSYEGDVYSDFDMTIKSSPERIEESGRSTGRFRVSIERAAVAALNGGGVEMKLEAANGDIYVRQKK